MIAQSVQDFSSDRQAQLLKTMPAKHVQVVIEHDLIMLTAGPLCQSDLRQLPLVVSFRSPRV